MAKNKNQVVEVVADPENDGREDFDLQASSAFPPDDGLTEDVVLAAPDSLATTSDDYSYGEEHEAEAVKLKADEVLIPMIKIVQELSKIWKDQKNKPEAERTCKLGDIYNTVTGQVYDGNKGIVVVPIDCQDCVIERKAAPEGTFLAKLQTRDPRVQEAYKANGDDKWKKLTSKQKTQLVYTEEVPVGLVTSDGANVYGVAMIPFSGTNVYPRKQWWNKIAEVPKTPKYAFRSVVKTELRKGQNGGADSYRFVVEPFLPAGKEFNAETAWLNARLPGNNPSLAKCLDFKKLYNSGALGKADYSDPVDSEDAQEAAALKNNEPAF